MKLKMLSDAELDHKTKILVGVERRVDLKIIEHLRENNRRKLFAKLGFSSLFDYCTKHLGCTPGSAHIRISAMRLINEVPEVEAKIKEGKLSVTTAAQVQDFCRREKYDKQELLD